MRIKLLAKYIAHDVRQLTYRYAVGRFEEDEKRMDAQIGENDSDDQLILRYIYTGTAKLRMILKDHIEQKHEDADDTLANKTEWGFTFKEEFADSHALAELMHWFVVKFALAQWVKMFSPNEAGLAEGELDEIEDELKNWLDDAMPMKEHRSRLDEIIPDVEIVYEPRI